MTLLLLLLLIAALALVGPILGADSRALDAGSSLLADRRLPRPLP